MNRTIPFAGAATILVLALAAFWSRQVPVANPAASQPASAQPAVAATEPAPDLQAKALADLAAWPGAAVHAPSVSGAVARSRVEK